MSTLVVVPTYNEAESIGPLLDALLTEQPNVDVLVVDDGSPDGTADLVDQRASSDPRIHVMRRTSKQGLGAAYRAGFTWGLARDYERLVEMDADGSHRAVDLGAMLDASDHADLVLGSRWVPGGGVVNWPWYRRAISRGGTWYAQIMLGLNVRDLTGGFRVFRRHTLEQLRLTEVASQGYCFQIDMARRTAAQGLSIVEVPITFVERQHGQSKMSGAIVREALWRVTVWGFQRRFAGRFVPLKNRWGQSRRSKKPRTPAR